MRASEFTDQGAAGIILYAEDTGRYGLQQRSNTVNDPGMWAAWGGGRDPGESLEQCARRELAEEGGYTGPIQLQRLGENPQYVTFLGSVPQEFEPRANSEWQDYCWVEAGDWPGPMHPGTAAALQNISLDENFADGKNPGRKGLSKRVGVNTKASVSSLRKTAKNSSGEKQRMAHWLANMKAGRAKAKRK
jgi:8-oxo-dGTP pyrophosphatase MutT (NUDIX family)